MTILFLTKDYSIYMNSLLGIESVVYSSAMPHRRRWLHLCLSVPVCRLSTNGVQEAKNVKSVVKHIKVIVSKYLYYIYIMERFVPFSRSAMDIRFLPAICTSSRERTPPGSATCRGPWVIEARKTFISVSLPLAMTGVQAAG